MRYLSLAVLAVCVCLSMQDGHSAGPPAPMDAGRPTRGGDDMKPDKDSMTSDDDDSREKPDKHDPNCKEHGETGGGHGSTGGHGGGYESTGGYGGGYGSNGGHGGEYGSAGMMEQKQAGLKMDFSLEIGSQMMAGAGGMGGMGGMSGGRGQQKRQRRGPMRRRQRNQPKARPMPCKEEHPFVCSITDMNEPRNNFTRTCRGKPCDTKQGKIDEGWNMYFCPDMMDKEAGDMMRKAGMMKTHDHIRAYIMDKDGMREKVHEYMDGDLWELMQSLDEKDILKQMMKAEYELQIKYLEHKMGDKEDKHGDMGGDGMKDRMHDEDKAMRHPPCRPVPKMKKPRVCKLRDTVTNRTMERSCETGDCLEKGIHSGNWSLYMCSMSMEDAMTHVKYALKQIKERLEDEKKEMMQKEGGEMGGYNNGYDSYDEGYGNMGDGDRGMGGGRGGMGGGDGGMRGGDGGMRGGDGGMGDYGEDGYGG